MTSVIWHDLNAIFFQNILRKHFENSSVSITDVQIEDACDVGENFMSKVKRVCVKGYKVTNGIKEDLKQHMIVKQVVRSEQMMERFPFLKLFKNEMTAYQEIIPELKLHTYDGKLPIPKCLYADECTIILEDLSIRGFANIDKYKGFSIEQIESILRALAKLHSASIALSKKDKEKFKTLTSKVQEVSFTADFATMQIASLDTAIRIFENNKNIPKNRFIIENLIKTKDRCHDQRKLIESKRPFRVINHGDSWGNNILIRDNEVILIDLQIMRYSSIAADLSYFFYINLRPIVRRNHLNRLLHLYVDTLNDYINKMGINMENELTFEWISREMNEFSTCGFLCALLLLPVFSFKKDDLNLEKNTDDMTDIDLRWSKCTPEYKERVIELVLDFYNS